MKKERTRVDSQETQTTLQPLITVITIVYNGEKHLQQTIQSVINQTYSNIEYIIVDGGSTDNTLSIIDRYRDNIDTVISEKDEGIADAMNKGVLASKGDYLLFIHADDYLYSTESITNIESYLSSNYDFLLCPILFGEKKKRLSPVGFSLLTNFKFSNPHQGMLCRRKLFDENGLFDKNLKINMDYDFCLRVYRRQKVNYRVIPMVLSVMRDSGISSRTDWISLRKRFAEERVVHDKNCNSNYMKLTYAIYWPLYFFFRKIKYLLN